MDCERGEEFRGLFDFEIQLSSLSSLDEVRKTLYYHLFYIRFEMTLRLFVIFFLPHLYLPGPCTFFGSPPISKLQKTDQGSKAAT